MTPALSLAWNADAAVELVAEAPAPALWFSVAQLAELRLPGLPRGRNQASAKRMIQELATAQGWHNRVSASGEPLARSRKGKGGGLEYHADLLPASARAKLQAAPASAFAPECQSSDAPHASAIWHWFEQQSQVKRDKAAWKLNILRSVEAAVSCGETKSAALASAASVHNQAPATLWNWYKAVDGVASSDWLPHLCPGHKGGGRECECDPVAWNALISDYLRPEEPGFESCVRRTRRAFPNAIIPNSVALRRKLKREVDPLVIIKRRKGREAHERTMPAQIRSVAELRALQLVNVDGHRWDVFVRWPNGEIDRPTMVAIQDVYSRKILGWRVDVTENTACTRLAFLDVFRNFGIPEGCLLDNGRAFASKQITGGAKTRYRFKIKEHDPTGLLPSLGINPKWATPYHGQAKPIERAFRDMCDDIAKCPAFSGAYTGNKPTAKPENYKSRAIDLDKFIAVVTREIAAHNARTGRDTEMAALANVTSFDGAFAESYAVSPIRKATPEQLRLAQLTAAGNVLLNRNDGSLMLFGNRYWTAELSLHAGERVTLRFDPDNLHSEVQVYAAKGAFLATAPVWSPEGFASAEAAGRLKKLRAAARKRTKEAELALDLLSAAELEALSPTLVELDLVEASVVRPVRYRNLALAPEASQAPLRSAQANPERAAQSATILSLAAAARAQLDEE